MESPRFEIQLPEEIVIGNNVDVFDAWVYRLNELPLSAIHFNICHDEDVLEVTDVLPFNVYGRGYDLDVLFVETFDDAVHVSIVLDEDDVFPAYTYRRGLLRVRYEILEDRPAETSLEFCDGVTDPPTEVLFIHDEGEEIIPEKIDSEVTFVDERLFRRGDADGNGSVSALLDAGFLLEWAFRSGPSPPCADAADADDNGSVAALRDACRLVGSAFGQSGDVIPDPGYRCGVDPTDDELDCEEYDECSPLIR